MKKNNIVFILGLLILFLLLFLVYKYKQIDEFENNSLLNNSLFIAYSTKTYEPVTAIWRNSLKDNNIHNVNHKVDDDSEHTSFGFKTDSWYTFVINKLYHLIDILKQNKDNSKFKYFIFTDCDIQYFNKNKNNWNELEEYILNSNKHIFFMRENIWDDVNTGFYIIKNDSYLNNIISYFENVIKISKVTSKEDAPFGDQTIINNTKNTIEYDYIPNDYMVWGEKIHNKDKAIIHHAVGTSNTTEKVQQLHKIYDIVNN